MLGAEEAADLASPVRSANYFFRFNNLQKCHISLVAYKWQIRGALRAGLPCGRGARGVNLRASN